MARGETEPDVEVRPFTDGDEAAVLELLGIEFAERDASRLRWQYLGSPDRNLYLGFVDGRLGGMLGDLHFSGYVNGEPGRISLCGDWVSHPDVRGTGLTRATARPFRRAVAELDLCIGFPRPEAASISIGSYGSRPLGVLPQWVRWHTAAAVRSSNPRVPAIGGAVVTAAQRARAGASRFWRRARGRQPDLEVVDAIDEQLAADLDRLAERSASIATVVRRRDAAYLRWRWLEQPDRSWRFLLARGVEGDLLGFAVIGIDPDDRTIGRIVDLLGFGPSTTAALVDDAARRLQRDGAARTVCELMDPRAWSAQVMRRAGFLDRGTGPGIMGVLTGRGPIEGEPGCFYLTMGDTDLQ